MQHTSDILSTYGIKLNFASFREDKFDGRGIIFTRDGNNDIVMIDTDTNNEHIIRIGQNTLLDGDGEEVSYAELFGSVRDLDDAGFFDVSGFKAPECASYEVIEQANYSGIIVVHFTTDDPDIFYVLFPSGAYVHDRFDPNTGCIGQHPVMDIIGTLVEDGRHVFIPVIQ